MSSHDLEATKSRRRGLAVWLEQFASPQRLLNINENQVSKTAPNQIDIEIFLHAGADVLTPPCFNWYPLEVFLKSTRSSDGALPPRICRVPKLCLLEDRRHNTVSSHISADGGATTFDVVNTTHKQSTEQLDDVILRQALNEEEMSLHLGQTFDVNRRVVLIANITPLCGRVLSNDAIQRFAPPRSAFKRFLQSHVGGEIYFSADVQDPSSPLWNSPKRYQQVEYNFTMTFHLSYVALRPGGTNSDSRGLRQSYSMIKPIESAFDDLYYHDAQISFYLTGTNDRHWIAYCLVDTFFGGEQCAEEYVRRKQDGPSGGAREDAEPCWDPREHFLLVLSQRILQISREWGNFFTVLMSRLDSYESFYIRTIDTNNLCDDESLTRTNSYTKAVSISRQSHDTLSTTLETLCNFLVDTEKYFEKKDSQSEDEWRGYFGIIQLEVDHLEMWKRRVHQRMQRFEAMKDGLVSYSALEESRRTTRQGSDIGILTNMTVAYLPFNLAAALFSISSTTPSGRIWVYWAVISFVLGLATFYFAFGNRVVRYWIRWNDMNRGKTRAKLEA